MRMKLSDIKISEAFAKTVPNAAKVDDCRRHWNELHTQDRYIVVNKTGLLLDGYIQYLVLKENHIEDACVKVFDENCKYRKPVTYVFGTHINSTNGKEYVWRVPKSWRKFSKMVRPGDHIRCNTSCGVQTIVVTRVEKLDSPPVNRSIRKVKNEEIVRHGQLLNWR